MHITVFIALGWYELWLVLQIIHLKSLSKLCPIKNLISLSLKAFHAAIFNYKLLIPLCRGS